MQGANLLHLVSELSALTVSRAWSIKRLMVRPDPGLCYREKPQKGFEFKTIVLSGGSKEKVQHIAPSSGSALKACNTTLKLQSLPHGKI